MRGEAGYGGPGLTQCSPGSRADCCGAAFYFGAVDLRPDIFTAHPCLSGSARQLVKLNGLATWTSGRRLLQHRARADELMNEVIAESFDHLHRESSQALNARHQVAGSCLRAAPAMVSRQSQGPQRRSSLRLQITDISCRCFVSYSCDCCRGVTSFLGTYSYSRIRVRDLPVRHAICPVRYVFSFAI